VIDIGSNHPSLKAIMLSANNLASVPPEMADLPAVEELDLSKNKFTEFPMPVCSMKSLEKLVIGSNEISSLPVELGNLENLVSLDVSHNQLTSGTLKHFVGNFQSLTNLFLATNQLTTLPAELKKLSKLKRVTLQVPHARTARVHRTAHRAQTPACERSRAFPILSGNTRASAPWRPAKCGLMGVRAACVCARCLFELALAERCCTLP
jgi:hypothetical protein